jgi:hypothetical protein
MVTLDFAVQRDLDGLVLELCYLAGSSPRDAFGAIAFELLEQMLAFDSALWGPFTVTPGGARAHSQYLHKLPARMLEDYEGLKQYDPRDDDPGRCGSQRRCYWKRASGQPAAEAGGDRVHDQ